MIELPALLLGWLLGLLSPGIAERIRRGKYKDELEEGIRSELKDLLVRMAGCVQLIEQRFGTYDHALVRWLLAIFEKYEGDNPKEGILESLRQQAGMTPEELEQATRNIRRNHRGAIMVKKFPLPYLQAKVGELSLLGDAKQRRALEVLAHLNLFNEEVDDARHFFRYTYTEDATPSNYDLATETLHNSYRNLSERGQIIVDRIRKYVSS